jgi:hypothetical protein
MQQDLGNVLVRRGQPAVESWEGKARMSVEKSSRPVTSQNEKKPAARAGGVQCLRCRHELNSYAFTRFTFLPYGAAGGNVVLECPKCGHIEFLSQNSPLLRRLNAKPVAVGDGD